MKLQLTEEQSKELNKYSDNPESEYIYSLQDLFTILPEEIEINNLIYIRVIAFSEGKHLCGYFEDFGWWDGTGVNTHSYYHITNNELIDCLYDLIIWNFNRK